MAITARSVALRALERFRLDGAFSDSLLASALKDPALAPSERALASRLVYGVLQNMMLLDFYADFFCDGKRPEPKVRDILRLALYQLLLLDKIPGYAAVNEAVELCKSAGLSRAGGFVNAVLRRAARSRDALPEIPRGNKSAYLSVKYSTPEPLVNEFIKDFGAEFTENLLRANNAPAPLTAQVNTLKTSRDALLTALKAQGIDCESHAFLPNALNLSSAGDISALEAFKDGLFYIQDAAATLAVTAAAPRPGQSVLDVCAAPGGKSFACALLMENKGKILARDIHENKLRRVKDGAARLGIDIIATQTGDAAQSAAELAEAFDLVIADVPCSGLGVIRKKPDIRYKNLDALAGLPQVQLKILEGAASCVRPGGTLLYSTCTVLRRENEEVVNAFLSARKDFAFDAFILPEPIGAAPGGMLTLFPHINDTDGFFICKMKRT